MKNLIFTIENYRSHTLGVEFGYKARIAINKLAMLAADYEIKESKNTMEIWVEESHSEFVKDILENGYPHYEKCTLENLVKKRVALPINPYNLIAEIKKKIRKETNKELLTHLINTYDFREKEEAKQRLEILGN